MNILKNFNPGIKLFFIVALVAVILTIGGILLLKSMGVPGGGLLLYECWQLEGEIKTSIENANYCNVDSDCIASDIGGCPFGCFRLVNRNADTQIIQEKISQYKETRCNTCIYGCVVPPDAEEIKCLNNQCVDIRFQKKDNQQLTIDTTSWQTYRNEEFGFEVKYPKEWFNNIDEEGNKKYQAFGGSYVFSNQYVQNFQRDFNITQKDSLVFFISIQKESTGSALFSIFENLRKLKEGEEFIESIPVTKERIIYAKAKDEFVANVPAVRYRINQGEIDFSKGLFPRSSLVLAIKDDFAIVFSFQGGTQETVDRNQGTFDQILSTFRFIEIVNSLKPADAQTPAAGACAGPQLDDLAAIVLQRTPDNVAVPRCLLVRGDQRLQIKNVTDETVTVTLGRVQMTIKSGETQTDSRVFGTYLALGVHNMDISPDGVVGVPGIWLQ